jgi:hypothetical protein
MPRRRRPRVRLDFFEELEALDSDFFRDLDGMIEADVQAKLDEIAEKERRAVNAARARRIHARLLRVEAYSAWDHTKHIVPDFFGNIKERVKATKVLHEKRERVRWFLRMLYMHWMFDIPIAHQTKWMGLRYSRHRKWFLKRLRVHKAKARKIRRTTKAIRAEERRELATRALDELRNSSAMARLRGSQEE